MRTAKTDQNGRMPRLIWVSAHSDLSLRWAHMPFCWLCHEAVQIAMINSFILGCDNQAGTEKSLTAIERDILVPCVRMVYHRWCNHRSRVSSAVSRSNKNTTINITLTIEDYSQSFVYCRVFVLLIIDYTTKKGVLENSRKCASEIVYFRSNPYIKQCELMC